MKRVSWQTRFGFYLAAIGSACGLGNLWRFPFVAGENGGGAFVLLYLLFAFIIGLPILIAELMIGRKFRKSVFAATIELSKHSSYPLHWVGRVAVVFTLIILAYYAVISGWVLHFLTQFIASGFSQRASPSPLQHLIQNGWLQVGLASVHLLVAVVVVVKGVQDGLEKWIGYMMPLFAVLLVILVLNSLSLDSSAPALRFLLYPNFSQLTYSSMLNAIGHVFFTLSVGFGTMVTFGSYLSDKNHIPSAGVRVAAVDSFISILAGLLIFPIVLAGTALRLSDPYLLFEALPRFLLQMPGGIAFAITFFLCLYIAALGASIGLLEVIVSNMIDRQKMDRKIAAWLAGVSALVLAVIPALSSTVFENIRIGGRGVLETLDGVLINWVLPLVALGLCLSFTYGMSEKDKEDLFVDPEKIESVSLYPYWKFAIRWLVPGAITVAFALEITGLILG